MKHIRKKSRDKNFFGFTRRKSRDKVIDTEFVHDEVWIAGLKKEEPWIPGIVVANESPEVIIVKLDTTGKERKIKFENGCNISNSALIKLRNVYSKGITSGQNKDKQNTSPCDVDDLVNLTHLHEAEILHSIKDRWQQGVIYTNTGPILIAVNPCKKIPIYTSEIMAEYVHAPAHDYSNGKLRPHAFALADTTYRNMLLQMDAESSKNSASILVSGESGAGKTETTKVIMRYLCVVSSKKRRSSAPKLIGSPERSTNLNVIEAKVLESNPILESFGNANTTRNANSSRFGKLIEIGFANSGRLVGAAIRTYLLEKVRIVKQAPQERNYHVFYEMLSSTNTELRSKLMLHDGLGYTFLCGDGVHRRSDGVDDRAEFDNTYPAMITMGFEAEEVLAMLTVVSGVLRLGNLIFDEKHDNEATQNAAYISADSTDDFTAACKLFGTSVKEFETALCERVMVTKEETYTLVHDAEKAAETRDSLAKAVYSRLFDHVVKRINESIKEDGKTAASIGILDIFGFEVFTRNSFEQLMINYTNERMQLQFSNVVFSVEQKLYESEGIKWSFVDFEDNSEVVKLIQSRRQGILSILDAECHFPRGSDKGFAGKLYINHAESSRFEANDLHKGKFQFVVHHYAGPVTYSTEGFVAKNRDTLLEDPMLVMRSCNSLASSFFEFPLAEPEELHSPTSPRSPSLPTSPSNRSRFQRGGHATLPECRAENARSADGEMPTRKRVDSRGSRRNLSIPIGLTRSRRASSTLQSESLSSQFQSSLGELMQTLDDTSSCYVRCLKPNDELLADHCDSHRLLEQLRYCGVLEAVRVARAGFPQRLLHGQFIQRYSVFLPDAAFDRSASKKMIVERLVGALGRDVEHMEDTNDVKPHAFFDQVCEELGIRVGRTIVFLRKGAHEMLEKTRNHMTTHYALKIQRIARGHIHKTKYQAFYRALCLIQGNFKRLFGIKKVAVILLQTWYRWWIRSRTFKSKRMIAIRMQTCFRFHKARKYVTALRHFVMVCRLQRACKIFPHRKHFLLARRCAITIQCFARIKIAKNEFRRHQKEKRSLHSAQNQLQQLRNERNLEKQLAEGSKNDLKKEVIVLTEKLKEAEIRNKALEAENSELQELLSSQPKDFEEKLEKLETVNQVPKAKKKQAELSKSLSFKSAKKALRSLSPGPKNVSSGRKPKKGTISKLQRSLSPGPKSASSDRNHKEENISKLQTDSEVEKTISELQGLLSSQAKDYEKKLEELEAVIQIQKAKKEQAELESTAKISRLESAYESVMGTISKLQTGSEVEMQTQRNDFESKLKKLEAVNQVLKAEMEHAQNDNAVVEKEAPQMNKEQFEVKIKSLERGERLLQNELKILRGKNKLLRSEKRNVTSGIEPLTSETKAFQNRRRLRTNNSTSKVGGSGINMELSFDDYLYASQPKMEEKSIPYTTGVMKTSDKEFWKEVNWSFGGGRGSCGTCVKGPPKIRFVVSECKICNLPPPPPPPCSGNGQLRIFESESVEL